MKKERFIKEVYKNFPDLVWEEKEQKQINTFWLVSELIPEVSIVFSKTDLEFGGCIVFGKTNQLKIFLIEDIATNLQIKQMLSKTKTYLETLAEVGF